MMHQTIAQKVHRLRAESDKYGSSYNMMEAGALFTGWDLDRMCVCVVCSIVVDFIGTETDSVYDMILYDMILHG